MKKRKGQITVFLVLILIVVLTVIVAQQVKESQEKNREFIDQGRIQMEFGDLPFQKFVSACLEKKMEEGLGELGRRGGRYMPRPFVTMGARRIALYVNMSAIISERLPAKEELEIEIEGYVTRNVPRCVRSYLLYQNMSIAGSAAVTLSATEIIGRFAGTARSDNGEEKKIEALQRFPTPYVHLFETARRIVALQKEEGTEMPLGALSLLADDEGVHFTIIQLGSGQFVIALTSEEKEEERGTKEERTTEEGEEKRGTDKERTEKGEKAGAGTRKKEIFQFGVQYGW